MKKYLLNFLDHFRQVEYYLVAWNFLAVLFFVLAGDLKMLPLHFGDFIFFVALFLVFALYRPGWSFLFFTGAIPLENINLAPESLGIIIRPYQFFGGLLILALVIRFFSQKINLKLPKFVWQDFLLFAIPISAFFHLAFSTNKPGGLKLIIVLLSFCFLYLLIKIYIQDLYDLKKIIPFILGSSLVVIFYGFWQNILFMCGLNSFETMPGRPNSTFFEAEWLGMYLLFLLAIVYAFIYYLAKKESKNDEKKMILTYIFLFLIFALLLITVSRSAWLGAIGATVFYFFCILTDFSFNFKKWQEKLFLKISMNIAIIFLLSLGSVYLFHLTSFQLFNRATSAGTGLQKITVSCQKIISLPEKITDLKELDAFDCRHINLEEISKEKMQNRFVTEIYRSDPNVSVRSEIYKKAINQIKLHPFLGIGFEKIPVLLGVDGQGTALNSSNIFLEIWLGSGVIGLLAFLFFLCYIFFEAIKNICLKKSLEEKTLGFFILISGFGIIIFNLFNTGLMLGFFWVWLGVVSTIKFENYEHRY
jgi:hypothetical protein